MKGYFYKISVLGCVLMLSVLLSACSKAAPKCDSGNAVDAVINEVSKEMKSDLNFVASAGSGALSDEEWKMMRASIVINVNDIREQSYDDSTGKRTCAGNLFILGSGSKDNIPITYVTEIDKASDAVKVTLSGYKEYKNKKRQVPVLPENK